nr:zinc knuckle CX2CX4HX4C [Tanacetum cinerariifolium]
MNVTSDNLKKWMMNTRPCKEVLTLIPVWVKIHDVPIQVFSKDGISLIAYEIVKPIILDSFTSLMCLELWGQSPFARCLIKIKSDEALKDNITIGIPLPEGIGLLRKRYVLNTNGNHLIMKNFLTEEKYVFITGLNRLDKPSLLFCAAMTGGVVAAMQALYKLAFFLCRVIKVANAGTIFSEDVAHMAVGFLIDVPTQFICYIGSMSHVRDTYASESYVSSSKQKCTEPGGLEVGSGSASPEQHRSVTDRTNARPKSVGLGRENADLACDIDAVFGCSVEQANFNTTESGTSEYNGREDKMTNLVPDIFQIRWFGGWTSKVLLNTF